VASSSSRPLSAFTLAGIVFRVCSQSSGRGVAGFSELYRPSTLLISGAHRAMACLCFSSDAGSYPHLSVLPKPRETALALITWGSAFVGLSYGSPHLPCFSWYAAKFSVMSMKRRVPRRCDRLYDLALDFGHCHLNRAELERRMEHQTCSRHDRGFPTPHPTPPHTPNTPPPPEPRQPTTKSPPPRTPPTEPPRTLRTSVAYPPLRATANKRTAREEA